MAVICVRATFDLTPDGKLELANQQEIVLTDVYEGDPHRTPLIRVGDLIPYKPAADVTVIGTAYAPGGRPAESWEVAVAVGSHEEVRLRVHGPRRWEPTLKLLKPTWRLGLSLAAPSVPLDYRFAAGGRFVGDPDGNTDPRNPLGPGILQEDWSRLGNPLRAPQIDSVRAPVTDPFGTPQPQGFGPIPPFWSWRQTHAGTYNETWRTARERRLPTDFDYRFYQSAHTDLILPYLVGDEIVRLEGVVPGGTSLVFNLPDRVPVAYHAWFDGRQIMARLVLDGLHIDLRGQDCHQKVEITWRGWIVQCPEYYGASVALVRPKDVVDLPISTLTGLEHAEVVK